MAGVTYIGLLRGNPAFRRLWFGTIVSFLGDWLTTVAVVTMATQLSDSSLAVSGVLIAKTLPIFLVSPWAGPLADRVDRRVLMIGTDVVRAVLVLVMVGCYLVGSLGALLVVLTCRTVVSGVFIPARTASVPDLAVGDQLPVAMALNGGTWSTMLALGAALGGLLTETLGVTGALLVDALTFLGSAAILWGLPALPPTDDPSERKATFTDGLRYLRGRLYLPVLLLQKTALSLSGAALVVLPLYAGGLFEGYDGPLYLGLLYAARGCGALVGSMGMRKLLGDDPDTMRRAMVPAYGLLAVSYVGMGLAPDYPYALAAFAVSMVGSGMVWTFSGTLAQQATERSYRGRLFSLEFGSTMLMSAVASLVGGIVLDAGVDPQVVVSAIGACFVVPLGVWAATLTIARDIEPRTS
jgi:MFS family permease